MIKKILIPVFLLFSLTTIAQQATSSPYSFFGIGDIRFKGTAENRLMGSVSVFPDSIHINLQNPASYSSLKLATFTLGSAFNSSRINSYEGHDKAQRTTVDYMALGLPVSTHSGVVLALVPYSAVGYRISNIDDLGIKRRHEGKGGLNKVSLGYGYQITNNFSVGADLSYNFGNIETNNIQNNLDIQYGSQEKNTSDLTGLNFNLGGMYQRKIKKYDFYGSLAYSSEGTLKANNTRTISTVIYTDDYTPTVIDSRTFPESRHIKIPGSLAIGAGIGQAKKWLVGTEVTFKQNGNLQNRFSDVNEAQYENGIQYSFGGYYIPNYNSFSNYFEKVTYRAGLRYEKTGMIIRNESIKDYAVTAGFGLPLGSAFSNINLGVEYGRRGTAKANLIEENYTNVIISLSLNDKWFVKRKFD
jgi:hypothetical protein